MDLPFADSRDERARVAGYACVSASTPSTSSCADAAAWIDRTIERLAKKFRSILLRGDTDYSLTSKFDEWSEKADFVFGYDAAPNVVAR